MPLRQQRCRQDSAVVPMVPIPCKPNCLLLNLQFEGKKRVSAEESMSHCYFGNLGRRVKTLPDSKSAACFPASMSHVRGGITISPIVVSATSIFGLPEIQLEREATRPTASADPGEPSLLL